MLTHPTCVSPALCALTAIAWGFLARAAEPSKPAEAPVSFRTQLAPLLVQKCQACHGPDKAKGGYRLDTFERLMKPGHSDEPPVTPGEPGASALYRLVATHDEDDRMPQKDDPLPPAQLALIERWIKEGATFDGPEPGASLSTLVNESQGTKHPDPPEAYPRPVPVLALAFSPDGKALAAGGYHEVTVWNPQDGSLIRRIKDLPQQTQSLAYSPDGSLLAVAGGTPGRLGEVRLIHLNSAEPPRVLDRIGDMMLAVAFSPDGTKLAAGGADGAVRVYDVASGKREFLVEQHADWVTAVAFSPDGGRVASASRDKSARVIDAKTGELRSAYVEKHEEPLFALAWAPDGKRLYTAGRDKSIHVWEPKEEGNEAKRVGQIATPGGDVLRLGTTAKGLLFSCSADGKVRQYEPAGDGAKLVRTDEGHSDWVYGLAADEKTGRVATGGYDGEVRVRAVEDGKVTATFLAAPGIRD